MLFVDSLFIFFQIHHPSSFVLLRTTLRKGRAFVIQSKKQLLKQVDVGY